jgi:hypothetical protein
MLTPRQDALIKGLLLMVTFLVILTAMFMPLFNGHNSLRAADRLFNSIAKGSTYFIPDLQKKTQALQDSAFTASLKLDDRQIAENAAKVLGASGAQTNVDGSRVAVTGDLKQVLNAALADADAMFRNDDTSLRQKYSLSGKEALFVWWTSLRELRKDLTRQKKFKLASVISSVVKKGVEVGYNFYGIEAQTAASKAGLLTFALVFYIMYTLWWGIAIMLLFDAGGLEMKARAKQEV